MAIQQAGRILDDSVRQAQANQNGSASTLPKYFIRNVDMYLRKICNHPFAGLESGQLNTLYFYCLEEAKRFEERHRAENTKFF